MKSRTCITCNTEFSYISQTGGRRFHCSPECRAKYKEQRAQERKRAKRGLTRHRTCPVCKNPFSYEIGQGKDRKFCSPECYAENALRLKKEYPKRYAPCSTEGCKNLANRVGLELCEACYGRLRRNGSVARRGAKLRSKNKAGYISLIMDHPLASPSTGCVYEHRKVVFDRVGAGPHPCYWCGKILEWSRIVIDHLNEVKDDNRFENLAISCSPCNRARGAILPFIKRMQKESFLTFVQCATLWNQAGVA
jgi:hypothetical protein